MARSYRQCINYEDKPYDFTKVISSYAHRNNDTHGPWSAGSQGESREYYYGNGMLLAAKDIEKGSRPGFGGLSRNPLEDVTFYHHDALGSVVMLTNDKGHVVESYQYDVYVVMPITVSLVP